MAHPSHVLVPAGVWASNRDQGILSTTSRTRTEVTALEALGLDRSYQTQPQVLGIGGVAAHLSDWQAWRRTPCG